MPNSSSFGARLRAWLLEPVLQMHTREALAMLELRKPPPTQPATVAVLIFGWRTEGTFDVPGLGKTHRSIFYGVQGSAHRVLKERGEQQNIRMPMHRPVERMQIVVLCDVARVKVTGMMVGHDSVSPVFDSDSSSPIGFYEGEAPVGVEVRVSVELV